MASSDFIPTARIRWAPNKVNEAWKTIPTLQGFGQERFVLQQWWEHPTDKTGEWRNVEKA